MINASNVGPLKIHIMYPNAKVQALMKLGLAYSTIYRVG
jgi:hypothetical protein